MMVFGIVGLGVLCLLFLLAKVARHFHIGPKWLRQLKIDKNTLY
jgi:hypothetical protein